MKDFLKNIKLNENNIGFGLGVAVMILTGFLLVNYFKTIRDAKTAQSGDVNEQTLSTSTDQPANVTPSVTGTLSIVGNQQPKLPPQLSQLATQGGNYTVVKGDSLWKIAQKEYGTGYAWSKIYEANKSVIGNNPSNLEAGMTLALPKADQAVSPATASSEVKEYTVAKGDSLWKIAVSQCGSGYAWSAIAAETKISHPSLIYAGTKLSFHCPILNVKSQK